MSRTSKPGSLSVLLFAALIVLALCAAAAWWPRVPVRAAVASQPPLVDEDAACAGCHAAIYERYRHTSMATGSGAAMSGLLPGEYAQGTSGVSYHVFARDGRAWMSYARAGSAADGMLTGERELLYYIGSGRQGRTYLYQQEGMWFELPVNWYGRRQHWGMAPAYDETTQMPASLPVDANCLHCHTSQVNTALAEAPNRFATRPFDQGGVGCRACHGDPAAHLQAHGHGPILNPAKMSTEARDSACIQCHLEGDAVVYRPGRTLASFRPGEKLSDLAVYFVRSSEASGGQRASSQYEALLKSACKRASGDSLTCTTCHDPHGDPAPAKQVAYFRAKCLSCHTSRALATSHHPEQPDCATCHMPSRKTADISHEQFTDHDIERTPAQTPNRSPAWHEGESLVPVGAVTVGDRELGLAYAQRAQRNDRQAAGRALELLKRAELAGADDTPVHVNLGWLEQVTGDVAGARREYAAALRSDPYEASALVNRAVLDARTGDLPEAVRLLDRLVRADPSRTPAGVDLLQMECRAGETDRAAALVETLRSFNPDAPELRAFGTGAKTCR